MNQQKVLQFNVQAVSLWICTCNIIYPLKFTMSHSQLEEDKFKKLLTDALDIQVEVRL